MDPISRVRFGGFCSVNELDFRLAEDWGLLWLTYKEASASADVVDERVRYIIYEVIIPCHSAACAI